MVISLFICEIIFKIGTKMPIFDWSLLRIFIGVNIFALIISLILSFIKNYHDIYLSNFKYRIHCTSRFL